MGEAKTIEELEFTITHLLQRRDKFPHKSEGWWNCQHAISARTGRLERMKK